MACHLQYSVDEGFYRQIQREELRYHVDDQEYSNNGIQPSNEPLAATHCNQDDPTIEQRKYPIDRTLRFS